MRNFLCIRISYRFSIQKYVIQRLARGYALPVLSNCTKNKGTYNQSLNMYSPRLRGGDTPKYFIFKAVNFKTAI